MSIGLKLFTLEKQTKYEKTLKLETDAEKMNFIFIPFQNLLDCKYNVI